MATVRNALLEATVLVVVLLLLFLGELRAALVVSLMLPLAALFTFLLMQLTGQSANLMSPGLAIAIGMLVKAAVVVVENTVTRLQPDARGAHLPRLHRVFDATREVATPRGRGHADHRPDLPAAADPGRAGGQAVRAGGIDDRVCAGRLAAAVADPDPGAGLVPAAFARGTHAVADAPGGPHLPAALLDAVLARPRRALLPAVVALVLGVAAYLGVGKSFMPTMDEEHPGADRQVTGDLAAFRRAGPGGRTCDQGEGAGSRPRGGAGGVRTNWAWTRWA